MKKFLFVLLGVFVVMGAFAAGENIPTSKSYVDSKLVEKQDIIPKNDGTTQVLTNTGTAGEYGTKGIYDANGEYMTQTQNLVDAATMNAGVQNAIDSEFQCIEWLDPNDHSSDCLLFDVFGPSPQQIIPREYTQIEYIETTGTQWIDTGILSNGIGLKTEAKLQLTTNTSEEQAIIGRSARAGYEVYFSNRKYIGTYHQNQQESVVYIDYLPGTLYTINSEMTNTGIYQNVNGLSDIYTGDMDPLYLYPAYILLFRHNNLYKAYAKVYYVKIWNNGLLVRNFIPARRNSDGEIGMYDTVSNTFFTNSGTGEFIGGPVVYLPTGE